ncbi:MAG: zinc dependent phospholipase C family protein [Bacillota bacterium]|nr:zinc dependent phospholipase C family protein [Bacillota bacterium]MDW7677885.1 zinc dependent phospholipase C family protein [Bacillota bacterium]
MLPQTHAIIAGIIVDDIYQEHHVKLNKTQLLYGSIKPDFYSGFPKLKHFKPESFNTICQDISAISASKMDNNRATVARLSQQIGVVTHYVADYFCVPHNDRETYHNHIIDHIRYENKLHHMYLQTAIPPQNGITVQQIDFSRFDMVTNYLDHLHGLYSDRRESLFNDFNSSLMATRAVATMIVRQALKCDTAVNSAA